MTSYFVKDEDVPVYVPIIINGQYRVPDEDSVFYTVKDNTGTPITGLVDVAVTTDATTTAFTITVPAINNSKASDISYENRFIRVKGTSDSVPFTLNFSYRIIEELPLIPDRDRVRSFLGVTAEELLDEEIDIYSSYFSLVETYGSDFENAFIQGGVVYSRASDSVYLYTALELLPSLQLKAAQSESDGVLKYSRFSEIDWAALKEDLKGKLQKNLEDLTVTPTGSTAVFGTFGTGRIIFES